MNDIELDSDIRLDGGAGGASPMYASRRILGEPEVPKLIKFLVDKKIVKRPEYAVRVLVGVAIFCFGLAGVLVYTTFFKKAPVPPNIDEMMLRMQQPVQSNR